jgi:S-DNA-T family DNA segregation ATPase FtsK/SpoIIIE
VSSHLGVTETLALLDTLKGAVRDFAAGQDQLESELRGKSAAESNRLAGEASAHSAKLAEALAGAGSLFLAAKESLEAKSERRRRWIERARKAAKKRALEEIEQREGRRKYKLQEAALEAGRRKETGIAGAAAALAEFQARVAENDGALAGLGESAKTAFRGYRKFVALLSPDKPWPEPDLRPDENQLFEEILRLEAGATEELARFGKMLLPRVFKNLRVWLLVLLLLLGFAGSVPILRYFGVATVSYQTAGFCVFGFLAALVIVYELGKYRALAAASTIAGNLARAARLRETCLEKAAATCAREQERAKQEFQDNIRALDEEWEGAVAEAAEGRLRRPEKIDEKERRASQRNERRARETLGDRERNHSETVARLRLEADARAGRLAAVHADATAKLESEARLRWESFEAEWKARLNPLCETIRAANAAASELFPDWRSESWDHWAPPKEFNNRAEFARLEADLWKLAAIEPKTWRVALPCPDHLSVPLLLTYPSEGSILFETAKSGEAEALSAINNILFRLLSTTPPGKLSFTILDPVGLGQSFAGIMHLADYEESLINSRIWTQPGQIEEKLAELNDHMEKVIQMYLRNEYATIAEYNARAGVVAEKYHFLVVAGFPVNFTDAAIRRLLHICASGGRCGVHTLIQWDLRQPLPQGPAPEELRKRTVRAATTDHGFELPDWRRPGIRLLLDAPPPAERATDFLHKVGRGGKDANRVEVPFEQVVPADAEIWTGDTTRELRVAIGRTGATKLQYLEIGQGTRQHGLIAGKTGSGKSTLFHVIITNLALWCGPDQVEFYLVDFKKGVEFKCYATHRLPHARVIAIESDREFGLSVLQRLDAELRRRGDLFRQLGVQDLAGYKRAGGAEPVPRSLLLIDEFQEFFVEEDRVSQGAALLLDRIVRQGRAFGIHVLLGSQTLGGAYSLARATIGQMVVRIALQCNEADALLIMDQDNPAPRLLSRPGEGIYNDAAGAIEGNSPFQTVWLSDETRDRFLEKVRVRAALSASLPPAPFVFEGNAPADARANTLLSALLEAGPAAPPEIPRAWLGAPNSIKGPTEARFARQSGSNLLIVGQNEEGALAILSVLLVSLAAQYPIGAARFVLIESAPPGSPRREFLDHLIQAVPHEIIQARTAGLNRVMAGLAEDLKKSDAEDQTASTAQRTFVLIYGLQTQGKLRQEDDFSFSSGDADAAAKPAAVLMNLITEGPARGFHVVASCDTYTNLTRCLGRKTLGEFEMRALFQMSAGDSASLIDTPAAGSLGLHRALFYNDREGYLETFRPYALPAAEWIDSAARRLASRRAIQ